MHVPRSAVRRALLAATGMAMVIPFSPLVAQAGQTLPGSWSVSPSTVSAGAGPSSYVWRFTTKVATTNGAASIAVPASWGVPQISNASAADFGIMQKGTCTGGHLHVYTVADGFNPPRLAYEGFKCTKANQFVQMSLNNVTAPTLPGVYPYAGYALLAPASTVVTLFNTNITVTPGPAKKLAFVVASGGSIPGPFSFQAGNTMEKTAVAIEDAFSNIVNSSAVITVTSSPLSGTLSKAATAGVATFSDLTGTLAGLSYPFVASSPGLTSASSAYNITPAVADHFAFDSLAGDVVAGSAHDVVVGVYDQYGNAANSVTSVALELGVAPRGATLIDADPVSVVNGKATFHNLIFYAAQTGMKLTADTDTGTAVPQLVSAPFDVTLPIVRPASNAGIAWGSVYGFGGVNWFQWDFWPESGNPYTGPDLHYAAFGGFDTTPDANTSGYVWEQSSSDPRALQDGDASAAAWYGSDFTLTETIGTGHSSMTVYLVDWDTTSRAETVTFDDGTGPQPVHVTAFHGGAYVTAPISNTATSVTIHVHSDAGANAVISGVFLD